MSLESAIENLIQDAIDRGEFDHLDGAGKSIDLTAYFNMPEDLRMAYSLLKSNKFILEEVELIKQIAELKNRLSEVGDENERKVLSYEINGKTLALNLAMEKYKRKG